MAWTVTEIAKATGLTRRHIGRLIKNGTIKGERKEFGWLVEDEEAKRFVQERKAKSDKSVSE